MSFKNRSPTSPQPQPPPQDLKQRVITCLNKLADRDTLALASAELESIARNLPVESISPFLNCIHNTDSSSKSPVRRQCVSLLTLLSHSHGNTLSPHLSKMVSTVSRRLRDPDSAVRSACVEATTAMSSHITKPPFSVLSKPLIEMLVVEQDVNSQIGAAMCLAAAIEAAPDPETEQLKKVLPKLGKLLRNDSFKAKPAVFGVIGSVASVGGTGSKGVLDWLVPCAVESLSSDDWGTRKAAAEALGKVAVAEKELATEYKAACVSALENKRFDKVKIVRETMNRSLDLWKEVPGVCEEASAPSQPDSSSIDNGSIGCFPSVAKSANDVGLRTPQSKKAVPTSRSPPSDSLPVPTTKKETPLKSSNRNGNTSIFGRLDRAKPSDWKVEIAESKSMVSKASSDDNIKKSDLRVLESRESRDSRNSRPEAKCVPFGKVRDEKAQKFGGLRSGSRVVPFHDEDLNAENNNAVEEVEENSKEAEDLSLIREQLAQIEDQQSNLLNLLQKFIGSSQSGINSLETRVNGLEMALDEISYDLAVSSGRIPNMDSADNTCCKLPGAEFLSPKFWRKTEGRFSTSRLPSSGRMVSLNSVHNTPDKDSGAEVYMNQRYQRQGRGGFVMNPLADACGDVRENAGFYSNRMSKNTFQNAERVQVGIGGGPDGISSVPCTAPMNLSSR
ncbi:Armadillo-like helical [Corchorus olitorius]|uniref:Armadillo-like helical n=1 Tax=Corchorus olitorius TaxID=93759 RepID=A0A1R3GA67_9ROSI|nr:Armadillo-like helical [Corchorus olitorius]